VDLIELHIHNWIGDLRAEYTFRICFHEKTPRIKVLDLYYTFGCGGGRYTFNYRRLVIWKIFLVTLPRQRHTSIQVAMRWLACCQMSMSGYKTAIGCFIGTPGRQPMSCQYSCTEASRRTGSYCWLGGTYGLAPKETDLPSRQGASTELAWWSSRFPAKGSRGRPGVGWSCESGLWECLMTLG